MIKWRQILGTAAMLSLLALIFVVAGLGWLLAGVAAVAAARWCARRLGYEWAYILWALALFGGFVVILDAGDIWQDNSGLAVAWVVGMFMFGWAVDVPGPDESQAGESA